MPGFFWEVWEVLGITGLCNKQPLKKGGVLYNPLLMTIGGGDSNIIFVFTPLFGEDFHPFRRAYFFRLGWFNQFQGTIPEMIELTSRV